MARAGLAPPVETATLTGPSRWTDGRWNVHRPGSSALLTQTAAAVASAATVPSTAAIPVAVTTSR